MLKTHAMDRGPFIKLAGKTSRTVLLVDDEPENLRALSEILEDMGLGVIAYQDARAALAKLREGTRVDLVITDYLMPGMDGIELLSELRRLMPSVTVIMMTAFGNIDTYIKSVSLGVFEYINKPIQKAEFERVVMAALAERERRNAK